VKALKGIGDASVVEGVLPEPPLEPPPPEPPEPDPLVEVDPGAAVEPERVVPLAAVFAVEAEPADELAFVSTVLLLLDIEPGESAELDPAADVPVVTVPRLPEDSADVVDDAAETPFVADAVSIAFPGLALVPDPAPDDEPAVLVALEELVGLVADDWM
jgi:hypothetical protein